MFSKLINEIVSNNYNVHGFEIFHNGEIILKHSFSPDKRYPIYSASKSFTSAAVGIAADEGKLSYDAPLYEFLERKYLDFIPKAQTENFKKLTFKRFMTMSIQGYPFRPEGNDWLEFALSQPIDYSLPPAFSYSNIPAYLVGVSLENALNEHLIKYLTPRLFEPLGIEAPVYKNCPQGHFYGASGMELSVHELSLLGQLYLQNGVIDGRRILSEKWIKEASSKQISTGEGGYGYFFWTTDNSFRISGKWGQKCLVYPHKNLMMTYLSDMRDDSNKVRMLFDSLAENF